MGRDGIRNELLRGAMTYLVLAVLRDDEQYGYQIAQHIAARSDGAFAPSEGSLYPALHRLEAEGALTAAWRDGERGPGAAGTGSPRRGSPGWPTSSRSGTSSAGPSSGSRDPPG